MLKSIYSIINRLIGMASETSKAVEGPGNAQQMTRLLQLNLFDRRDLLSLWRGDPLEPPEGPQHM